ncbi:MAG: toll/interleukin-1 receptor domain-containing protein [Candidatus Bathyarchaeota archaeon]|nr:toll/interleukin-1 receptor domain-containing protein [Candidatus Bathyarchaeota archaeon]
MKTAQAQIPQKNFVFFISHNTDDISTYVKSICEILETCKIKHFFADRDAPIGGSLPATIKDAINESEVVLLVLTKNSKNSLWVNQEIGYALGRGIPVIPLKKGKITVEGLIDSTRYVPLADDPLATLNDLFSKMKTIKLSKTAEAAIGAIIGIMQLTNNRGK